MLRAPRMRRARLATYLLPVWLRERCECAPDLYEAAGALYESWRLFAHERGEEPGSPPEFAAAMEARGFACDRIPPIARTRIRWGLRLR